MERELQSIESRLESRAEALADYQRKREELGRHVGVAFEYEDKLVAATARQQEIVEALDLTKNQAGTQREDGSAEETAAVGDSQRSAKQSNQSQQANAYGFTAAGDGSMKPLEHPGVALVQWNEVDGSDDWLARRAGFPQDVFPQRTT